MCSALHIQVILTDVRLSLAGAALNLCVCALRLLCFGSVVCERIVMNNINNIYRCYVRRRLAYVVFAKSR
jgi:hypothetical protein